MTKAVPVATLHDHLARYVPVRIFPPGTTPAYSKLWRRFGRYIVERGLRQPFNDYVAANIFKPLGMTHSTFAQPLPPELKPLMSAGYTEGSEQTKTV